MGGTILIWSTQEEVGCHSLILYRFTGCAAFQPPVQPPPSPAVNAPPPPPGMLSPSSADKIVKLALPNQPD